MLQDLPTEILSQICSELPSARSLANLSSCSHQLNSFVKEEGWRVFCRTNFPASLTGLPVSIDYAQVSQSVTALSRGWDRRALLNRFVELPSSPQEQNRHGRRPRRGQTMGFQPMIDSQEVIVGSDWTARHEFLVFGAGVSLHCRLKQTKVSSDVEMRLPKVRRDQHGHIEQWKVLQDNGAKDGQDDITGVKLFSRSFVESRLPTSADESIISLCGTASGSVTIREATLKHEDGTRHPDHNHVIDSDVDSSVRSVDLSPNEKLAAAGFADRGIALFSINHNDSLARSCRKISTHVIAQKYNNLWTSKFLTDSHLAIGTGRAKEPLQVYSIVESGLLETPTRTWHLADDGDNSGSQGAIHCIHRLPPTFSSAGCPSNLFLTANSDGVVRLHDLRSDQQTVAASFIDPISDDIIFSLTTKGNARIIAGSNMNSLIKIFDMRMPGANTYSYLSANGDGGGGDDGDQHSRRRRPCKSFSVFLGPLESAPRLQDRPRGGGWADWRSSPYAIRRLTNSPVYSLSSPSAYSPRLFVGLEGNVAQVDVVDVFEKYPDPVYNACPSRRMRPKDFWDPDDKVTSLALYEHNERGQLKKQTWPDFNTGKNMQDNGLDLRWNVS